MRRWIRLVSAHVWDRKKKPCAITFIYLLTTCQPCYQESRAPVLAVDPPPITPTLDIKMSLTWGLPLSHSPQSGKLYLVNLGIPKNIYKEVGIKFSSPFGAKFVIPLHDAWKVFWLIWMGEFSWLLLWSTRNVQWQP